MQIFWRISFACILVPAKQINLRISIPPPPFFGILLIYFIICYVCLFSYYFVFRFGKSMAFSLTPDALLFDARSNSPWPPTHFFLIWRDYFLYLKKCQKLWRKKKIFLEIKSLIIFYTFPVEQLFWLANSLGFIMSFDI